MEDKIKIKLKWVRATDKYLNNLNCWVLFGMPACSPALTWGGFGVSVVTGDKWSVCALVSSVLCQSKCTQVALKVAAVRSALPERATVWLKAALLAELSEVLWKVCPPERAPVALVRLLLVSKCAHWNRVFVLGENKQWAHSYLIRVGILHADFINVCKYYFSTGSSLIRSRVLSKNWIASIAFSEQEVNVDE